MSIFASSQERCLPSSITMFSTTLNCIMFAFPTHVSFTPENHPTQRKKVLRLYLFLSWQRNWESLGSLFPVASPDIVIQRLAQVTPPLRTNLLRQKMLDSQRGYVHLL